MSTKKAKKSKKASKKPTLDADLAKAVNASAKQPKPSKWWKVVDEKLGLWKLIWKDIGIFYHVTTDAKGKRIRKSLRTRDEAEARRSIK